MGLMTSGPKEAGHCLWVSGAVFYQAFSHMEQVRFQTLVGISCKGVFSPTGQLLRGQPQIPSP